MAAAFQKADRWLLSRNRSVYLQSAHHWIAGELVGTLTDGSAVHHRSCRVVRTDRQIVGVLAHAHALISEISTCVRACVANLDKRKGASGELPQSEVKGAEVPRPLPESSCQ